MTISVPTRSRNVPETIAILVTRRCNMTCAHCSVESGPRVDTADPTEEELLRIIRESAEAGVGAIQFTGGEPMIRHDLVLRLMRQTHRLHMASGITTNGFWGKKPRRAKATLKEMMSHGLLYMTVSYDRYHAEFMGPQPILNLAEAASELGFFFNVNVTRTLQDENLDEYARLFGSLPNVRMRLYDVQPVGRARNFEMPSLRAETEGFCNAANQATFTDDGRVIACNGPAYFDTPESPRHIGDTRTASIAELLERHSADAILDTIRTFGPAGLRDELKKDARFADKFDRRFAGQCDLCHHITGDPEMVNRLRDVLTDSRHAALRSAKRAMIGAAKTSGELTREYVNGPGMAGIFHTKATGGQWPGGAEHLLGRADIDWDQLATYLAGCGLAGTLAETASQEQISRWAPAYFGKTLQKRAMRDALRELSHRETLDKLHDALLSMNLKGILLKGAALYLAERAAGIRPARIPGDIDILVADPKNAAALRRGLIETGFSGDIDAPRSGPHHLAPVQWRGSVVEIHTGIMPSFWGLPESRMLRDARQLPDWQAFQTLSLEDMIVHEAVHCTTHLYSFGLKLAVDTFRINRLRVAESDSKNPVIDWQNIAETAGQIRCSDAFWVPVIAMHRGLKTASPFSRELIDNAPSGKRFRRLCLIAFKRMFTATDDADKMNPFTRNGIFLLLHRGTFGRIGYMTELLTGDAAESRRTAMAGSGGQSWKNLPRHLKSAMHDVQAYRRAIKHSG